MLSIKINLADFITQIFSICFLVITFSLLSVFGQTQKTQEAQLLSANQTIERELAGGQTHKYLITLKANEFLQIMTEQKGAYFVVRLFDSNQRQLAEVDSSNPTQGFEKLLFITEREEEYEIQISAAFDQKYRTGRYTLQWSRQIATEKNRSQINAKKLYQDGLKLSKKPETRSDGITKLQEAVKLYQQIGDTTEEAGVLKAIAGIYYWFSREPTKTIDYYNQALLIFKSIGDKNGEAGILKDIAIIYTYLHDYNKANDYHNRALVIFRSIGDKDREAQTLLVLAQSYLNITSVENTGKAIENYNQLVEIYRNIKDEKQEASTLLGIGSIFLTYLRDNRKALDYYNQSLSVYRKIGDEKRAAWILEAIGEIYAGFAEIQKALDYYNQSLSVYRKIEDKKGEARMLKHIGNTYGSSADRQKQIEYYDQSLSIYRSIGDKDNEANLLILVGDSYYRINNKEKKWIDYYTQALSVYRNTNNKAEEFSTLNRIGWKFNHSGDYQQALEYYNQALSVHELNSKEISNHELSNLYDAIGGLYGYLGNKNKQTEYINKSKLLSPSYDGSNVSEASSLRTKGWTFEVQKEYQKALEPYKQALNIYRDKGTKITRVEKILQVDLIIRIIKIYGWLGDKEKQLDYENQALALLKNFDDQLRKVIFLQDIAFINRDLGNYQKALEFLNQALDFSDIGFGKESSLSSGLIITISSVYQAWGRSVYQAWGDKPKAIEYLNKALSIYRARGVKNMGASALQSFGSVYLALNEYQTAISYFNQALQIHTSKGTKPQIADALHLLMFVCKKANNYPAAIFYGKQSVNNYQELRQSIRNLDKETQKSYLGKVEPTYRLLADILISEGRLSEAQAVIDLLKEEEFKHIVRRSGEPLYTLPYSGAEEEVIKIIDRLAALGRELSDLKAKPKNSLTREQTKRLSKIESVDITTANKALRQAIEALSTVASDVSDKLDLRMKDNIQNILPALGKGVVALYTIIGKTTADENADDKTNNNNSLNKSNNKTGNKTDNNKINVGWVLLVTPDFRKAYPIDTTELEQTVFKLREALRSPTSDPQPVAQELYKKLFLQTSEKQKTTLAADLETYLGKQKDKTLMWSLDGVLRYVPMAALHDGKGYLVEKYRNVVFNTASLGTLLVAAKPNWEVVGLGVSTEVTVEAFDGRMLRFSALKGSESELNSIIKEKNRVGDDGIFSGTLKINNDFTKEALFEGARTGMPVIHISGHFWFNPTQEKTSFLLLGNGGRLEVTEFQDYPNLFSNVDFLSLSACDTATGGSANNSSAAVTGKAEDEQKARESNGKEIEGFAYVAQTLGAKSVMASLWRVSDEGTKELMLKFYQIKKEQPQMPKGEALRQAQLSLLRGTFIAKEAGESKEKRKLGLEEESGEELKAFKKDEKAPFGHPYYWSPFILIGNWR